MHPEVRLGAPNQLWEVEADQTLADFHVTEGRRLGLRINSALTDRIVLETGGVLHGNAPRRES
jgi:hypothetical protein